MAAVLKKYIYEREKDTKRSVATLKRWEKHFNVLCSETDAPQLCVEETLYKYTWAVLQGGVEDQQCTAAAAAAAPRHSDKYPQQRVSTGRPSQSNKTPHYWIVRWKVL